jgi:hypothetical protein
MKDHPAVGAVAEHSHGQIRGVSTQRREYYRGSFNIVARRFQNSNLQVGSEVELTGSVYRSA